MLGGLCPRLLVPLGATGPGTRPVCSQPALKGVTLGPIVQSSPPRAQRPERMPVGGGSQLARPAPRGAAGAFTAHFPESPPTPDTLTHDASSWRQAVCVPQDSAPPALPCPYPLLRVPVPTHPQVLEEASAYAKVAGSRIFSSLTRLQDF